MNTIIKTPTEATPEEIDAFAIMLGEAGTVDRGGLPQRIATAQKIVFVVDGDEVTNDNLAAIGAIKVPNASYSNRVFGGAGQGSADGYGLELGWIVVDPAQRRTGIGKDVCAKLMDGITVPIFATTETDNQAMRHILEANGFTLSGNPFTGYVTGKQIVLYVKH